MFYDCNSPRPLTILRWRLSRRRIVISDPDGSHPWRNGSSGAGIGQRDGERLAVIVYLIIGDIDDHFVSVGVSGNDDGTGYWREVNAGRSGDGVGGIDCVRDGNIEGVVSVLS